VLGQWVKETAKSDYNKGNVMFDQGRFARAAYYFRKAIKTAPMGEAWFNLGLSEKALGNESNASEAFSAACRMDISPACTFAS
jgi:TolA-binding protein